MIFYFCFALITIQLWVHLSFMFTSSNNIQNGSVPHTFQYLMDTASHSISSFLCIYPGANYIHAFLFFFHILKYIIRPLRRLYVMNLLDTISYCLATLGFAQIMPISDFSLVFIYFSSVYAVARLHFRIVY